MNRKELRARLAKAMYDYCVAARGATWGGKRPGIILPRVSAAVLSSGAFRTWTINLVRGKLVASIDGYSVRAGGKSCSIGVLVGEGRVVWPTDDSRSHHTTHVEYAGGKIVWLNDEDPVPWDVEVESLAEELAIAAAQVAVAVKQYDDDKYEAQRQSREADVAAALKVFA